MNIPATRTTAHALLETYIRQSINKAGDTEVSWDNFLDSLVNGRAKPQEIIRTLAQLLNDYPDQSAFIAKILADIRTFSRARQQYDYPEFFWLVLQSDNFMKSPICDQANLLSKLGPVEVVRARLSYLLITRTDISPPDLIRAYYYTGHTPDSLQLMTQLIPASDETLYVLVYTDALSMLYRQTPEALPEKDQAFLVDFFKRGLKMTNPRIQANCQKALQKLAAN